MENLDTRNNEQIADLLAGYIHRLYKDLDIAIARIDNKGSAYKDALTYLKARGVIPNE